MGFSLRGIGGIGVGIDHTKLVQRQRLVPACLLLPGQVKRLTGGLPGLFAVSRQPTDLAEPHPMDSTTRACAETCADRLLQQRTPLREASLERIGWICSHETLLVKSQICRKQFGHTIFETQKDRDLAPVKRTLITVEITLL